MKYFLMSGLTMVILGIAIVTGFMTSIGEPWATLLCLAIGIITGLFFALGVIQNNDKTLEEVKRR